MLKTVGGFSSLKVSGLLTATTLATGNTTVTGFANVTGTIQGGSSLTIAGAASGITTLAAGNTTISGFINVNGGLSLANGTSNILDFAAAGVAAPTMNTLSSGTKLLLYPALSPTQADYAIGIDAATLWHSVPVNSTSFKFKWFGAATEVAFLDGAGNFKTSGYANVGGTLQVGGISTFNNTVTLGSSGLSANGGLGTAGQVLASNGTAAYWSSVSVELPSDDTTSNTTFYPIVAVATANSTLRTSSTKLSFNPNTGILTATSFAGNGSQLTNISAADEFARTIAILGY